MLDEPQKTTAPDSTAATMETPLSPSAFLSPRITAELDSGLDDIEELFLSSSDDDDGTAYSPSTDYALAHTLNTTPTATNRSTVEAEVKAALLLSTTNDYSLTNAVHMEVQENAKLPTFNLPVNRSNASWQIPAPRGRRSTLSAKRSRSHRSLSIGSGDSSSISTATNIAASASAAACPASPIPKLAKQETTELGPMALATSRAIDEIMRLNENDIGLSESFLDGDDRSSAALAYSFSGGMPRLPEITDNGKKAKDGNVVKNGHQHLITRSLRPHPGTRFLPYNRQNPLPIPTLKKPSPPIRGPQNMAAALETAAAIANRTSPTLTATVQGGISQQTAAALSVQPIQLPTGVSNPLQPRTTSTAISVPPPPKVGAPPPVRIMNPIPPHLAPRSTMPQSNPTSISVPKPGTIPRPTGPPPIPPPKGPILPNTHPPVARPPPRYPPVHPYNVQAAAHVHARARQLAAHAHTKASITHATVQRSKFGFGGNHKVPSVPGPPPSVMGYKSTPISSLGIAPSKPYLPSATGLPKDVGTVIAYERKKQRAKDARMKLNESIEELAVAIDLAGSQSKERFNYIVKTTGCANSHVAQGPTSGPPPPPHPLARLMDETIQQTATAKKWDRPSFVGLSATVIRSLNAQCEGLMREVAQLRNLARRDLNLVADRASSGPPLPHTQPSPARANNGVHHAPPNGIHNNQHAAATLPGHAAKKQKLDFSPTNHTTNITAKAIVPQQISQLDAILAIKEQHRCTAIRKTIGTPNLLKNISSFLDPKTLYNCLRVSKRWRSQNIFQNPELWLNLCVKRFGASAVRKWQDQDEEGVGKKKKHANMKLYRRMSEENVKPYCPMEGTVLLGGATIDGLVSCWVSLMDRSNGETSRSVMQHKVQNDGQPPKQFYGPIPVVELRLLVQNTGYSKGVIIIPDQQFSVDASTRRKGEKMLEVAGDARFQRQVLHIERSASPGEPDPQQQEALSREMCHLRLFESAVVAVHIHARGCSTTAKFCNRTKKIQLLVSIDGTTRPLAIPFHCTNEHQKMTQHAH